MIAEQVGGKAARDALYLAHHPIEDLPGVVIVSGIATLLASLGAARWLRSWGPHRVIPAAFGLSGLLLFGLWALVAIRPGEAAIAFYVYHTMSASVLISGFWSVVNERWDPRAAKSVFSRIATGGTLGGLIGGIAAQQLGSLGGGHLILPLLGALHLGVALIIGGVGRGVDSAADKTGPDEAPSAREILHKNKYLRTTAGLVGALALSAVVVDYFFKATAAAHFGNQDELLAFFGAFYAGTGILAFALQAGIGERVLRSLGLTGAISSLPLATAASAVAGFIAPGIWTGTVMRGIENTFRNSLFRSGYELIYTPVSPAEKRSVKAVIDVAVERGGDIAGGLVVQGIVAFAPAAPLAVFPAIVAVLSAGSVALVMRLHRGYVETLERSMITRAIELDLDDVTDSTTRSAILDTRWADSLVVDPKALQSAVRANRSAPRSPAPATPDAGATDPVCRRLVRLRSPEAGTVRSGLVDGAALEPPHVPQVIALLARDDVWRDAVAALRPLADSCSGQLGDYLADPDTPFAVRRRIPWILRAAESCRAAEQMLVALDDERFEVRYRAARALHRIKRKIGDLGLSDRIVEDAILREIQVPDARWSSRRLLDHEPTRRDAPPLGVEPPADMPGGISLEHTFCLLSLLLPDKPLRVAFQGLFVEDKRLHGTALEYIEGVAPERIRKALLARLEAPETRRPPRPAAEAEEALMTSSALIRSELAARLGMPNPVDAE